MRDEAFSIALICVIKKAVTVVISMLGVSGGHEQRPATDASLLYRHVVPFPLNSLFWLKVEHLLFRAREAKQTTTRAK